MVSSKVLAQRFTNTTREVFDVLGVKIDSISMDGALARICAWVDERNHSHMVTFTNVHAVMEAYRNREFRRVLNEADMVCPDGMPLVWVNRMRGGDTEHVCGPDLMLRLIASSAEKGYSHFFYGASPGVVERLAKSLEQRFPGIRVAGWHSPPYRELTAEEDAEIVTTINQACPDVLWVGLGCPKQEQWIHVHRNRIRVPVILGVGQAFDLHAGVIPAAPRWMRDNGLEWIYRLSREPRRLWGRYLKTNPVFVFAIARESMGMRIKHLE